MVPFRERERASEKRFRGALCSSIERDREREMEEVPGFDLDLLFFGGGGARTKVFHEAQMCRN